MQIQTQRFGIIERPEEAAINFPSGIFGFERQRSWLLLGDSEHGSQYWLQNTEKSDLSFPMVDPREFIADYSLHVERRHLDHVFAIGEPLIVLSVLTHYDEKLVLNLRNPILINPKLSSGRQVVTSDNRPIQYELPAATASLKQTA